MFDQIFIVRVFREPLLYGSITLIVIFSICLHEFMHALVALRQGDDTAAKAGHLTLNPMKQMGFFSLIMLAFVGIAWGQVPVNRSKFKHRYSDFLVSFAGPATNLGLWLIFGFFSVLTNQLFDQSMQIIPYILFWGATLNLILAFFNSLPIPGLDGGVVLTNSKLNGVIANSEAAKGTLMIMFLLIFLGFSYIFRAAAFATEYYFDYLTRTLF